MESLSLGNEGLFSSMALKQPQDFLPGVYCKPSGQEKGGKRFSGKKCQVFIPGKSDWKHIFPEALYKVAFSEAFSRDRLGLDSRRVVSM